VANALSGLQALLRKGARAARRRKPRESAAPAAKPLNVRESSKLLEAKGEGKERKLLVVLISEGLGNHANMNYYGPEAIASAPAAFEGKPCYLDHPRLSEERDLPERTVDRKVGYYKNCRVEEVDGLNSCVGELHLDESDGGDRAWAKAQMALKYRQDFPKSSIEYVGFSVNGDGDSEERTMAIEGMGEDVRVNYITRLTEGDSCDMVTSPGRGGKALAVIEDENGARRASNKEAHRMKKLKAAMTAFAEAMKMAEGEDKVKKVTEAYKKVVEAQKALEADAPMEADAAMFGKKEGESADDHKARLHGLAQALTKHMEAYEGGEPDPARKPDDAAEQPADSEDTQEAKRDAVRGLIKESGLGEDVFEDADIARLAKKPYREAKAEIALLTRQAKGIAKKTLESVSGPLHRAKVLEADGTEKSGNAILSDCLK